ncbi:MAG: hypothetical protein ACI8UO_006306 [Verrucomicrobiales bacterium]|jgi:hypothetical protein
MKTSYQLLLCILAAGLLVRSGLAAPVENLTLDRDKPLAIPIGTKVATTLQFPRPIQGLFGYGLTTGDAPGTYHYAHPEGSHVLALRNLMPDKETFVSVLLGKDDLFVLHLKPSTKPPVTVRLRDPGDIEAALRARAVDPETLEARRLDPDTGRLFNLLKLGKNERVFRIAVPHLYKDVETRRVEYRHDDSRVATVVTKVHRFPSEDAVFLFAHIENKTGEHQQFDPASIQVKAGSRTYPAALVDSAAMVPANGKIPLQVIIRGGTEGERAHLSIKNEFRLLMPEYAPCIDDPSLTDALGLIVEPASIGGPDSGLLPPLEEKGGSK